MECLRTCDRGIGTSGRGFNVGELCIVSDCGVVGDHAWLNCVGKIRPEDCGVPIPGWNASAFRPIYRPRAEFIESLKAPPVRVSEEA